MSSYNIVASTEEATVVAEYIPESNGRSEKYQSEAELEREFIQLLTSQGYDYLTIHHEADLIANLRRQLELLNDYTFTDGEWKRFFKECIANANEGIVEKTRKIQEDYIQILQRDDGTAKNIYLLDKKNIHNNRLQVINQYEEAGGKHKTRYDVTILVNGLPLVHVELKRAALPSEKLLIRLIDISATAFGLRRVYSSMCRFLSSPTAPTPNITATQQEMPISKRSSSKRRNSKKDQQQF
jgi:type I restriction enzyme, R subunit